jgi:hypothetical protein
VAAQEEESVFAVPMEFGRTLRYALRSNARTARLASLIMLIAVIYWIILL